MSSPRARAALGAIVLLAASVTAACGSATSTTTHAPPAATSATSSTASRTTSSTASPPPAPPPRSARRLQAALLANTSPPRPASASCRPATTAERAAAPFGQTTLPVFVCLVGLDGHRDTFDVQVLNNGCYVAERTRPGQAIYGCGAESAS